MLSVELTCKSLFSSTLNYVLESRLGGFEYVSAKSVGVDMTERRVFA